MDFWHEFILPVAFNSNVTSSKLPSLTITPKAATTHFFTLYHVVLVDVFSLSYLSFFAGEGKLHDSTDHAGLALCCQQENSRHMVGA